MMNKITFPLKPRMQGPQVADLQDALKLMLERDSISPGNPRARAALLDKLPSEHQTQTYGSATNKIVTVFQEEQQLRPDGIVGQQTADAINALLKEWGVLSETTEPEAIKYQVQGQI
jgi:peptidoglycan hydrolase-like protein with peptidoglycan-binding domain